MKALKSIIKSIPLLHKLARRSKGKLSKLLGRDNSDNYFYTLSPDVLVAIFKAFNHQKHAAADGPDLFDGHGYYEFGLYKGFSFWFAEQMAREFTNSNFRFVGFDSFEGLPHPKLEVEARAFREGNFRGTYKVVTENLRRYKTDFSRIQLHKGFYSDLFF